MARYPRCTDERDCFARKNGKCEILRDGYQRDAYYTASSLPFQVTQEQIERNNAKPCPYCKPAKDVTNGKRYPYDNTYYQRMSKSYAGGGSTCTT